jgi:phosphoglycerate dehydrogenase-like enzyme
MQVHRIFSDTPFDERVSRFLQTGVGQHEIIVLLKCVGSVLSQPEPDAAFPLADIAFGQPDIESITHSEKLKWLHISTAGFTRYDTPGFRALVAERGLIVTNSSSVYASACAEHVFNMLPDNPASYRFINAARLAQMKPTAVF